MRFFKGDETCNLMMSKDRTLLKLDGVVIYEADHENETREAFDGKKKELLDDGWKKVQIGSWVITKDLIGPTLTSIGCPDDTDVIGPFGCEMSKEDIIRFGIEFQMYDDDGEHYYNGYCVPSAKGIGEECFRPLDDFGSPNAGCTYIKYKNEKNEWSTL